MGALVSWVLVFIALLQGWVEAPFRSRRNIAFTMLGGASLLWLYNKSEQGPTGKGAGAGWGGGGCQIIQGLLLFGGDIMQSTSTLLCHTM